MHIAPNFWPAYVSDELLILFYLLFIEIIVNKTY